MSFSCVDMGLAIIMTLAPGWRGKQIPCRVLAPARLAPVKFAGLVRAAYCTWWITCVTTPQIKKLASSGMTIGW